LKKKVTFFFQFSLGAFYFASLFSSGRHSIQRFTSFKLKQLKNKKAVRSKPLRTYLLSDPFQLLFAVILSLAVSFALELSCNVIFLRAFNKFSKISTQLCLLMCHSLSLYSRSLSPLCFHVLLKTLAATTQRLNTLSHSFDNIQRCQYAFTLRLFKSLMYSSNARSAQYVYRLHLFYSLSLLFSCRL